MTSTRWRTGLVAGVATVLACLTVHASPARAADGSLRSGEYELVLTTGRPITVRQAGSGATVLTEQQPLQLIIKNGETPADAGGQYTSVALEGGQLVGTGEVRSRNGSVFRFRDSYTAASSGGFAVSRTVTVVSANAADQGFDSRFTIGSATPRALQPSACPTCGTAASASGCRGTPWRTPSRWHSCRTPTGPWTSTPCRTNLIHDPRERRLGRGPRCSRLGPVVPRVGA